MKARLLEARGLAPEVKHFVFDVPELERLEYAPGQFLSLVAALDGREITRAYSLASPPDRNRFELCLNRVAEGRFSPFLFDLMPGATVDMQGPYGTFTLRAPGDALFIATGTGIAPIRAILHHLTQRGGGQRLRLLFGVRHPHTILYREEFEAMAGDHSNFSFWPTLSRPDPPGWTGRTGHVQAHLDEALAGLTDPHVYICGLKAMVDDVRAILKSKGFDRRRVVYEKYD